MNIYMGFKPGGNGTYNLGGCGELNASDQELIGDVGTATFTQSGGTNSFAYQFYLGYNGGTGNYILSAGTWADRPSTSATTARATSPSPAAPTPMPSISATAPAAAGLTTSLPACCPPGAFPSATTARGA